MKLSVVRYATEALAKVLKLAGALLIVLFFSISPIIANPFDQKVSLVVIDAGHGGHDPGAVANGIMEKNLVLKVCQKLARMLEEDGMKVVMTRTDDVFLELEARCAVANSQVWPDGGSAIFISVHANSSSIEDANGYEVFSAYDDNPVDFLNESTPTVQGFRFAAIASNEASRLCAQKSNLLSERIVSSISSRLPEMRSRGAKEADLYVLNCSAMPSVLVEIGFLSNPDESRMMKSDSFQIRMAQAIKDGIEDYSGK